ncbi:ubiquitin-protein ligase E3C-like [Saccoglossus kowalevskii]|uniref:HECT-type E3 ubiquitin transferase n=1 Tax=Saccoglossus kowalevskii TaxID=10224 RepID=A0ABM0MKX4_SACKO|nr:PREDICTED: ubiquitin-protein ligase E3C-like [Saccoglossus kowalevskii]
MFGFNGDYRSRPKVSLGGASKQEKTESLLLQNKLERQKRENHRRRIVSATQLQSWWRGSRVRQNRRHKEREDFDVELQHYHKSKRYITKNTLSTLYRQILYFYKERKDSDRLVSLCQLLIKHPNVSLEFLLDQPKLWVYQTGQILLHCCQLLETAAQSSTAISSPLRVIEIYTSIDTYRKDKRLTQIQTTQIVIKLMSSLIHKGYYQSVMTLLNERVPSDIEQSPNPPTPIATTVLELVLRPIKLSQSCKENKQFRNVVFEGLCQDIFCPSLTDQIGLYLLPALAYGKYPFPFVDFLHCLIPQDTMETNQSTDTGLEHLTVWASPWLLYSVLLLVEPVAGESLKFKFTPTISSITSLSNVRDQCLQLMSSVKHVKCLLSLLTHNVQPSTLTALCTICHVLMTQQRLFVHKSRLLSTLAFNKAFLRHLWYCAISVSTRAVTGVQIPLIKMLSRGSQLCKEDTNRILPLLSLFCSLFQQALITLHDAEFYGGSGSDSESLMPFEISELIPMSLTLRDACIGMIELAHPETKPSITEDYRHAMSSVGARHNATSAQELQKQTQNWAHVFRVTTHLVKQLHERDIRRQFCPNDHWLSKYISISADKSSKVHRGHHAGFARMSSLRLSNRLWSLRHAMAPVSSRMTADDEPPMTTTEARQLTILTELPFVVPFEERVKIFQGLLIKDKEESQGGEMQNFLTGPVIDITIRRNYIYEDAFDKLRPDNEPDLKKKMRVQLINAAGLNEAGIDGGGLFREFLSELLKAGFDPNRGFFKTTYDRLLYPNPQASLLEEDYTKHYYFMGRMLGKVIYENMLIELPFASFFLSKILGRHSADVDIHHLQSLDPELYKNLLFLKNYDGDVSDLDLDFTVMDNDLGETKVHELKLGGREIPVTINNRIEYIHLIADYRLNKQIRPHCIAFREGLSNVINLDWLRMFDYHEIQTLISGAAIPVDLDDLRQHTNYSGGYTSEHEVIQAFWSVVENFNDRQKRQLLKFVTSCSRPPLLGFKDLHPAFCIHYGGSDADRLPSASTCMNLLKLPAFTDKQTLSEKLLYAIESGAGFELS